MRTRWLILLWLLFLGLVGCGIHGSSISLTSNMWARDEAVPNALPAGSSSNGEQQPDRESRPLLSLFATSTARTIRSDEWLNSTPYALAQLTHSPRFPVINTNIGDGQNMLLRWPSPVWHITTLSRPGTWGFFLFGAKRGLAWQWWFPVFGCFTALLLLFEIILKGHSGLAAFGALWFCASAYVILWSLWPASVTFFPALACLTAYHLATSEKTSVRVISAILLGLSLPGFVMFLYPPWQVPVGYLFLVVFAGLVIRDRLWIRARIQWQSRLIGLGTAVFISVSLLGAFLWSTLPQLKLMTATVYPGLRATTGGGYGLPRLMVGLFNLATNYKRFPALDNPSEASSFYLFFPAVFFALLISRRIRERIGAVGWALIVFLLAMLVFDKFGLPEVIAKTTFMSLVAPKRAQLAVGLASIILCVIVMATWQKDAESGALEGAVPWIGGLLFGALFIAIWVFPPYELRNTIPLPWVLGAGVFAAAMSILMLAGRKALFASILGIVLVLTSGGFNPVTSDVGFLYRSRLSRAIVYLNRRSNDRPLWICYGGNYAGVLVSMLGGRTVSGIQWPPFMSIWRAMDPGGANEEQYNRYAHVSLTFNENPNMVRFSNASADLLEVSISPENPVLKSMGAHYVIAVGDERQEMDARLAYRRVFQSEDVSIYDLDPSSDLGPDECRTIPLP